MKNIYINWFKNNRIDILIWFIFLFYEITVVGLISKTFGKPLTYFFHYGINISFFYLHALVLFPWAIKKEMAIWRIPLILLIELAAYAIVVYGVDVILIETNVITHVKDMNFSYAFILTCTYRGVYFLGFATGYYFIVDHIRERKISAEAEKQSLIREHKVETELAKAQNAFLKAQINPHFLFNTLDFVYHSIDTETHKAAEVVVLLSRMMRYAIRSDENVDFILLEDEIEQVENLLYLHQLRKENDVPVQLRCSSEIRTIKLIPLVLLTLVENIFKHGDLSLPEHEALIKIEIIENSLCIETNNLIDTKGIMERSSIGLNNTKKRLEYAYGQNISFEHYSDTNHHFIVKICIPLDALSVHETPSNAAKDNDKE